MTQTPPLLRWIAALLLCVSPLPAAPLITEFLASNGSGLKDADGDRPDWIEIHNPDSSPLDLGGYHLTDDPTQPARWTVPAGVIIPAEGYILIFASGKDRRDANSPLHTDFKLSTDGEFLGLYAPGGAGTPLSKFDQNLGQLRDVSYGLTSPDPTSPAGYFTTPTPGAANTVQFSLRSRTFNQGSPQRDATGVALRYYSPGATIRYTTNGATPVNVTGITGFASADPDTDTVIMPGHGLSYRDEVRVSAFSGSLPGGLGTGVNYYVFNLTPNTFQLLTAGGLQFLDGPPPGLPAPVDITSPGGDGLTIRRHAAYFSASTNGQLSFSNYQFFDGDEVDVSTTGKLPGGLSAGTSYFIVLSAGTLKLSKSPGGAPVAITSTGSGFHSIRRRPSPVYTGPISPTRSGKIRARAFETGRMDSAVSSETYLMIDPAAQSFTSSLPIVITETWGRNIQIGSTVRVPGYIMIFEPREPDNLARMTNPPDFAAPCTFKHRGPDTFGYPKYSLSVELVGENGLERDMDVLGMPADSDWVLHAPYGFDRPLMHNDLAYRLSRDIGRYAPRTKLVEHFHNATVEPASINGAVTGTGSADYSGVYSFMEKINRGRNRVDVEKITANDATLPEIQGGYIFKVDRLDPGEIGFGPLTGQSFGSLGPMAWVTPREFSSDPLKQITPVQRDYLRGYIGEAWSALGGPNFMDPVNGYAKYWDVDAMIDHQILNIATKNPDANRLDAYWHKPRYGKLTAGPVWDFDRTQGSADGRDFNWGTWRGDTSDLGTDYFHFPWYRDTFRDPNFWQRFIDRFHELRTGPLSTQAVHDRISEFDAQLNPSNAPSSPAKRNALRWGADAAPRSNNTLLTNNTFNGQHTGEIAWLKYWWQKRLEFMDGQFTRPATASLPSGPITPGSIVTLTSPSLSTPGVKILYTTNGTDPRPVATAPGSSGDISPDAIEYTGPITINAPAQFFVRTLHPNAPSDPPTQNGGGTGAVPNGSSWSAPTRLFYFPGAVSASAANILITEVLYHPSPPTAAEIAAGFTDSNDFEFIRLTNIGPDSVDLTGIYFAFGVQFTAVPGLQNLLPAGASCVIVENPPGFRFRFGNGFSILGEYRGELNDGGEYIRLHDRSGAIISEFYYGDRDPWPAPADMGYSLIYIAGDPFNSASWCASVNQGGSLGATHTTAYDRWLHGIYSISEAPSHLMNHDDDGDGLNNLGEFIFATNPRAPGRGENAMVSAVPKLFTLPPGLSLRCRAGLTGVTWIFETATILPSWVQDDLLPPARINNDDGTETITWRANRMRGEPRLFMRVRATSP